jgi:L-rhamnose mutarotase
MRTKTDRFNPNADGQNFRGPPSREIFRIVSQLASVLVRTTPFIPDLTTLTMIRKAFVMSVHPGREVEYERRHRPIWPELEAVLKSHGVHNYSIFLLPATRQLFAYAEIEDEARWAAIARTPECQRWWVHMGDVMPSHPDHSPVAADLQEVFHLD